MTEKRPAPMAPVGAPRSIKRALLEFGAAMLQTNEPVRQFDIYVVGFHCAKQHPHMQMEAHHFCTQVNDDLLQCIIFDGNTADANLIGIEYIISEKLFLTLPEQERGYWHPHNYEVLSGSLVAPGLPDVAEQALMRVLVNSYGKTWHLWHTGQHTGAPGDPLPYGDATLMWSFNRDGECDPKLRLNRATRMEIDEDQKRQTRQALVQYTHPQWGVDALKPHFPQAEPEPPGVRDVHAADASEQG